jgi:transcriptional regulator with GAF, ATPase, and Fis domain
MATQASWSPQVPAVNHNASFEIDETALDSDELCDNGLPHIVGNSAALRRALGMVRIVAPTNATVLIQGGTGILSTGVVLSGSLAEHTDAKQRDWKSAEVSTPVTLERAVSSHILRTLQQTKGVIGGRNGAAARLGMPLTTLISKMQRLGINRERRSIEFGEIAHSSDWGRCGMRAERLVG